MATTADTLERGRYAFARRAWRDAFQDLATADAESKLGLDDVELLALAAFLTGNDDAATDVWTRAHREAVRRGDLARRRAAPA